MHAFVVFILSDAYEWSTVSDVGVRWGPLEIMLEMPKGPTATSPYRVNTVGTQ